MPAINGTYAGTFTSVPTGVQIKTTIQITQMPAADSDGYLHVTGSATFNSPCFSKGTIASPLTDSLFIGDGVGANLTTDERAGSTVLAAGVLDSTGKTLTATYQVTGGLCDGDHGNGTLTLQ